MSRPVILDVDTGNDDAVAIVLAAMHPEIDLLGCTTVAGNLTLEETTDNTLRILQAIGRSDIEVHAGLSRPYAPRPYPFAPGRSAGLFHQSALPVGDAGLRPQGTRGVEWMIETLRAATEAITLIPVAPLTNIAAAITVAPDILDAIDEIIIMGGGWKFGNRTPAAEFNIYADPVAADVVLRAGIPRLTLVPLDATHEVLISRDEVRGYRELGTRAGVAVADVLDFYIDGHVASHHMGTEAAPVHDALCVAYAIDSKALELREMHVAVDTVGYANYGRTTVDVNQRSDDAPNVRFALSADAPLFHRLMVESLSTRA